MYSLDGVALHNVSNHWRIKATSVFDPAHQHTLTDFNAAGRDGTVQVRGFIATPTVTIAVTTESTNLALLRRLFRRGKSLTVTADSTRALNVELQSLTSEKWSDGGNDLHLVVGVFRCPDVYWRDVSTTDYGPTTITSSGQSFSVLTASEAPVRDALISVAGSITGLVVTGSNGTYFGYAPNVPGGTFLTFDCATGRAWTGAAAFLKTTEVTANVTNGPFPYFFEFDTASSGAAGSSATVTYTANTSATFRVRGANAYERR